MSEGEKMRRKAERRDEMVRFGARLPGHRASAVQARLDSTGISQQQVAEYLLTAWGYGLLDLFEVMRQVHEHEAKPSSE